MTSFVRAATRSSRRSGDARLWALAAAAATAHLGADRLGIDRLALATKPVPVLAMAASLLPGARRSRYRRWIATGLALGAVGDVLLDLDRFVPGLASFLVGHLAYLPAFLGDTVRWSPGTDAVFAAWVAALLASLDGLDADLRGPVIAYAAVLAAVMSRAWARRGVPGVPTDSARLTALGATVFGLSDSLIALDRFGPGVPAASPAIMLTYWAGQAGIALGAHRHRPDA